MRRYLTIILMLFLGASGIEARHYDRGYDNNGTFVGKGTWIAGGTARYSQHLNDEYDFLVIGGINSEGFDLSASPKVLYMFKDNMGLGMRVSYGRSMLDLTSADLALSDISMSASDCYQIQHKISAHALYRAYIPIAGSRRIAMFADVMLGGSYKEGIAYNAASGTAVGTFRQVRDVEFAVDPGIAAFLSDRLSLEVNVGMFGFGYSWSDQIHNQVGYGSSNSANAGFMMNLLSLGVGLSYYFL